VGRKKNQNTSIGQLTFNKIKIMESEQPGKKITIISALRSVLVDTGKGEYRAKGMLRTVSNEVSRLRKKIKLTPWQ